MVMSLITGTRYDWNGSCENHYRTMILSSNTDTVREIGADVCLVFVHDLIDLHLKTRCTGWTVKRTVIRAGYFVELFHVHTETFFVFGTKPGWHCDINFPGSPRAYPFCRSDSHTTVVAGESPAGTQVFLLGYPRKFF